MRIRNLLAWASAWAACAAGATSLVFEGTPFTSVSDTSWTVSASIRNVDSSPSSQVRWQLWAAESVEHARARVGRYLSGGDLPSIAPGGSRPISDSGGHDPIPSGTYQLVLLSTEHTGAAPDHGGFVVRDARLVGTHTFLSGSPNYTGLWYWEPGWGISLSQQGSLIFAVVYTYSAQGEPMWLVASRVERRPDNTYRGRLYRMAGPPFNAAPWGAVAAVDVGEIGLRFQGTSIFGIVTYTADGVTVSKDMFRQQFWFPIPVCGETMAPRTQLANYQDLWWNPAEPGWGVSFAHQGDKMFATLFTYGANGTPAWFVASNLERLATGGYAGELYRTTGPSNADPRGRVTVAAVGSMNVAFDNGEAGTLTYVVDGTVVTKRIERQVFSAPRALCQ